MYDMGEYCTSPHWIKYPYLTDAVGIESNTSFKYKTDEHKIFIIAEN